MSSVAGGRCGGVHDITGAGPRTTSGVTGPTAKAVLAADAAGGLERGERAVEPSGVGRARPREAAFQHILAVEMRTLAVGRGDRMHDAGLAGPDTCGRGSASPG